MENKKLRLLSNVVIAYMLIAFAWWSVLLYTKNQDAFMAKAEYLQIRMAADRSINSAEDFLNTQAYQDLYNKYKRQEWMIFGEAAVFIVSLIIGIYLINNGYRKEIALAQQRRNFLLSITHELKSPIASVKLILETFLKRKLSKEKIDQFSSSGIQEAERLNDLVNNLLLAAKLETSYEPIVEDIDLNELYGNIIERMQRKFPKANISFHTELGPHFFSGDSFGMEAILVNLIENAIKYSPSPATVECSLTQDDKKISLQVADQGLGIAPEERHRVLERFYRVGDEQRRKTKGTGLGLYIVHQIIKAHQGKIQINDNQPKGTKFIISFPLKLIRQREIKHSIA